MKNLIIIIFIVYIFATQHMIGGYIKMNDDLSKSLFNLMYVCSNAGSIDLNNRYEYLTK